MKPTDRHTVTASEYISKYFLEAWGLAPDALLETEIVSPKTLLNVNRLDLVCKLYYIDCLDKGVDMAFAKELYRAHIEAFSDGVFVEPGLKTKNSIRDYYDSFESLIADIKANGFDPSRSVIPVGEDGAILDGSHRAAIGIYYDIPLTVVHIPDETRKYDHEYFREKGLDEEYLDFMAYQYIRFADRAYTVCLWPAAYDEKKLAEADKLIRGCAAVTYRKEVMLNFRGVEQLMISFYKSMEWTGSLDNGFGGVESKARDCYRNNAPTTVYVISGPELEKVQELKQRIRDLYAIENSSVHITDTHAEAVEAGRMLLNKNSIDFMNHGDPYRDKDFIKEFSQKAEASQPCSGMETTLSLYGIGTHNACGSTDLECELQDPKDHFYFWGVRLPSIDRVKTAMKEADDPEKTEILREIGAFEQKKHSRRAAAAEHLDIRLKNGSKKLSGFFKDAKEGAKRKIRVAYHQIRYRDQRAGKCERNIEDLQSVFLNINTTTADYVMMRNWEGFFDDILLEGHNDIDLLCRDKDTRDIIVRLLDAKPLTFDGFHYCFKYKGREVTLDTRMMGDGYYDLRWQRDMLKQKKLHPLGFYVMDPKNYYYSLVYHAIYQKKDGLSEEYAERLGRMSPSGGMSDQEELAEELDRFMKKNRYAYTETMDRSVVKAFDNTEIRKKIRYPANIRMRHLAEKVKSRHPIQKMKICLRKLIKRG